MLKRSRCQLDIKIDTLMMTDSLEMSEKDTQKIIEACRNTPSKNILITHGTDKMVETAAAIANSKCVGQKTEARLSPIAQPSVLTFQSSVLGGALACQNPHAPDQSVFHSLRPIHNCPRATIYNSPLKVRRA